MCCQVELRDGRKRSQRVPESAIRLCLHAFQLALGNYVQRALAANKCCFLEAQERPFCTLRARRAGLDNNNVWFNLLTKRLKCNQISEDGSYATGCVANRGCGTLQTKFKKCQPVFRSPDFGFTNQIDI